MRKYLIFILLIIISNTIFSCASTRTKCRGNGSWYGKRNLTDIQKNNVKEVTFYDIGERDDDNKIHI